MPPWDNWVWRRVQSDGVFLIFQVDSEAILRKQLAYVFRKSLVAFVATSIVVGVTALICELGFRTLLFSHVALLEDFEIRAYIQITFLRMIGGSSTMHLTNQRMTPASNHIHCWAGPENSQTDVQALGKFVAMIMTAAAKSAAGEEPADGAGHVPRIAALMLIASLGFVMHARMLLTDLGVIAGVAIALHGAVQGLGRTRPRQHTCRARELHRRARPVDRFGTADEESLRAAARNGAVEARHFHLRRDP